MKTGRRVLYPLDRSGAFAAGQSARSICHHLVSHAEDQLGNRSGHRLLDGAVAAGHPFAVHRHLGGPRQSALHPHQRRCDRRARHARPGDVIRAGSRRDLAYLCVAFRAGRCRRLSSIGIRRIGCAARAEGTAGAGPGVQSGVVRRAEYYLRPAGRVPVCRCAHAGHPLHRCPDCPARDQHPALYRIPQPERNAATKGTFWQDFAAGFRYILAWRGLLIVLGMVMVINFFYSAAESLTPLLISKHFQGEAQQLGWWQAMFATGTIMGGIILGAWGGFKKKVHTAQFGLIVLGIGTTIIGIVPVQLFWLGLAANTLTGLILPITNGSYGAILQSVIAPEMQGRVFAFIMSAAMLVSPLGLVIAGPISDSLGIQLWFLVAGIVCAIMGIAGFFIPEVTGMEEEKEKQALAVEPS